MIHYLRVHPGWAWPLGSLIMAGLIWCAWRLGRAWADRTEPTAELLEDGEQCIDCLRFTYYPGWGCTVCGKDLPDGGDPDYDDLGPEEQADQLIHEWHDDPPGQDTEPWNLWDQWWADMDSLERECWRVRVTVEDSDRMWDELKQETRALCPLAA